MPNADLCLVCRVLTRLCALPLGHVSETMRPLPVERVAGVPPAVRGVSIIRGAPVPVVDVAWVLAGKESHATRFVTVNTGDRRVALAVDTVIGVRRIRSEAFDELPPLLRDANTDVVSAIGTLDAQLLVVLRSARLIPEPVWSALAAGGAST
ncbi:MAG: purine-binding chemotaxis protein CheW [Acidobacteria bacterium]|nr:purine-binding chemotaxis protein CheW [Acidobacteriota bacterium]